MKNNWSVIAKCQVQNIKNAIIDIIMHSEVICYTEKKFCDWKFTGNIFFTKNVKIINP